MIPIPFDRETFAREMKPRISGTNLNLDFSNIQSTLVRVGAELQSVLSPDIYNSIASLHRDTIDGNNPILCEALDYLQRAMLHFAVYHHLIYLITRIGNDGVTVKKNDDETTIFKYQQDQLSNTLINDAWFWLDRLLSLIQDNVNIFPLWETTPQAEDFRTLRITPEHLNRYLGINSLYFYINVRWIIREVFDESFLSRRLPDELTDTTIRAVCYEVMARAIRRLAYHALPAPIRLDINNELGKNHSAQADTYIRDRLAIIFEEKAKSYWITVDNESLKLPEVENVSPRIYTPRKVSDNDRFGF